MTGRPDGQDASGPSRPEEPARFGPPSGLSPPLTDRPSQVATAARGLTRRAPRRSHGSRGPSCPPRRAAAAPPSPCRWCPSPWPAENGPAPREEAEAEGERKKGRADGRASATVPSRRSLSLTAEGKKKRRRLTPSRQHAQPMGGVGGVCNSRLLQHVI